MSGKRNIPNDGQALTTPDVQRIGDGAASADDRVYEVLTTPPSLGAKTIVPTSAESSTVNPCTLCVPGTVSGTVQLQPCALQVGSPSIALAVALEATLKAALASALFSANSSGSTRYDLVYATVQRTVDLTGPRAIKGTVDGTISNNPSVNLEDAPTVTLTILPNVGNVTPTATMPADNNGGSNGEPFGSYNFPIALIALANGYASGGTITQSMITQLWSGGFILSRRLQRLAPLVGFYSGGANEKPAGAALTSRVGSGQKVFVHLQMLSTTPSSSSVGIQLDASIDWRHRLIWGFGFYLGSANVALPLESLSQETILPYGSAQWWFPLNAMFSGAGQSGAPGVNSAWFLYSTAGKLGLYVDNAGVLRFVNAGTLTDNTHGDAIALVLEATDQFVAGM